MLTNEASLVARSLIARNTDLYFKQNIAKVEEHCLRQGLVATHIYMDSNQSPYMFFAFPAGNSGAGMWFETPDKNVFLTATERPRATSRERNMHGAEVHLRTSAKKLVLKNLVLGSMRFIRDAELGMELPKQVLDQSVMVDGGKIIFHRTSINQMAEYQMEIEPQSDTHVRLEKDVLHFESENEVRLTVRAFTSEPALTPLNAKKVFKSKFFNKMDARQADAFSFLLYKEKFAAGAPRYLTQFGRDALITLHVLMETMNPEALEDLISTTISGMHPTKGFVSHEQNEGDFTSYERWHKRTPYKGVSEPIENYKMIDDDYLFPIVISEYMKLYPGRVANFMARKDRRGLSQGTLILNNFKHIIRSTRAFAAHPTYRNLIHLKTGETAGQWRDSPTGLGGGVYPFDVNAALVPGALHAMADVYTMKSLAFYDPNRAFELRRSFAVWNTQVVPLFEVQVSARKLLGYGSRYIQQLKLAQDMLPPTPLHDLRFPAIALDSAGRPIPVMHSDDSLMMTFGFPSESYIQTILERIHYSFPYGLKTPVGILVANPVFASDKIKKEFDDTRYHGRVSWAMQEDLFVYGFARQIALGKLSQPVVDNIHNAVQEIGKVIRIKSHMGGHEVFAVLYINGHYLAQPFAGDAKSNSNQLWSHLRIAMPAEKDRAS